MPDIHDLFVRAAEGIPEFDADGVRRTLVRRRRRRRLITSAVVAVVVAVSGAAIGVATRRRSPQLSIAPAQGTSTSFGATTSSPVPGAPLVYPRVATHPETFRGFGKLAYPAGGELWVLDGTSASPRSIALPRVVEKLRWSHDGDWLAVQTESGAGGANGQGTLFVVRSDGTTLVPVPASVSVNDWDWSPKRDVLAVVDQAPTARTGSITSFVAPDFTRAVSTPIAAEYPTGFLSWSPDGRHLIYKTYNAEAPPHVDQLWSLDESACPPTCSPAPRQVSVEAHSSYHGDVGYLAAGWSGDGSRLLVWLDDAHSGSVEMDGLRLASITGSSSGEKIPVMLAKPSWIATVPNTSKAVVAVGGDRSWDAHRQLDSCDLDQGVCKPLVVNAGPVIDPAVSPNGQRLAYVATDPVVFANNAELPPKSSIHWSRTRRLVVAGLSNQNPAVIATGGVVSPRWAADDHHLVFWRAGYLWLVDADHPAPVAIAGTLAPRPDDFGFGAFERSPYILPGDDVWDVVAWLR